MNYRRSHPEAISRVLAKQVSPGQITPGQVLPAQVLSRVVRRRAFSMAELLVVVGIILALLAILIPTVGRVRIAAANANTQSLLNNLSAAIEEYKTSFSAYPGPLPDSPTAVAGAPFAGGPYSDLPLITPMPAGFTVTPTAFTVSGGTPPLSAAIILSDAGVPLAKTPYSSITGTHNLVLGLLGGLYLNGGTPTYNPALVGKGPTSLNVVSPKTTSAFMDPAKDLSWRDDGGRVGNFVYENAVKANDCPIPSFVDRYNDPLPILYLRARPGTNGRKNLPADPTPTVVGYNPAANVAPYPYNLAHVLGYTSALIGAPAGLKKRTPPASVGHGLQMIDDNGNTSFDKSASTPLMYRFPYEGNLYLTAPGFAGTPRKKDEYILISAGPDRIYGTPDDLTTFGQINP